MGPVVCHDPLQIETESQLWMGFEPYSHSRPCFEHEVLETGTSGGHAGEGPLSAQSLPHPPLLPPLLLPPLLLPLPPPPLLVV